MLVRADFMAIEWSGWPGSWLPASLRESGECDSLLDRGVLSKSHIGAGDLVRSLVIEATYPV